MKKRIMMKKIICLLTAACLPLLITGCSNSGSHDTTREGSSSSIINESSTTDELGTNSNKEEAGQLILESDNEYMVISSIDISSCEHTDGYFSGEMTYISQTTQKYVDEYDDYFYRQIYFGFYNANGDLVGEEIAQNNYTYSREYTSEESTYVMVASKEEIVEAKVLKIVCEKLNE